MKTTILIIDDQLPIRTLLEFVLEDYLTISRENGKKALEWLYNNPLPDLILVDLEMPEVDGYEFIRILKSSGFYDNIPIIILAGTESSAARIKCFEVGIDDFIRKPFNPVELKVRIKNVLSRSLIQHNS
jgi:DNA-binding response OmpR family regulator